MGNNTLMGVHLSVLHFIVLANSTKNAIWRFIVERNDLSLSRHRIFYSNTQKQTQFFYNNQYIIYKGNYQKYYELNNNNKKNVKFLC